ncbi:MAG: hypothetical protein AAFN70_19705, partial [Planctomycetota bacterium]
MFGELAEVPLTDRINAQHDQQQQDEHRDGGKGRCKASVATLPPNQFFKRARSTSLDRFVIQESSQIVRHRVGGRIAIPWLFLDRFQDDRFQVQRETRVMLPRRRR